MFHYQYKKKKMKINVNSVSYRLNNNMQILYNALLSILINILIWQVQNFKPKQIIQ